MIPVLPANPWTITPVIQSSRDRLEYLRRFDTYERSTTPERELGKQQLEKQIKKEKK